MSEWNPISDGGVATPQGFVAGGIFAGIKRPGKNKRDLGLIYSKTPSCIAATFSRNSILSPSVVISRDIVESGRRVHAVVASSGSANCAVGEQGLVDGYDMTAATAEVVGVKPEEVLIATTGLIGVELPMNLIKDFLPKIELSDQAGNDFARSIMTTDSCTKEYAIELKLGGKKVVIAGTAKGSGMIHPNMATMLAFLTTDADVDQDFLRSTFSQAVELSFNQIDVDGDQSTNDMALIMANGVAGNAQIKSGSADAKLFSAAVQHVCEQLAQEVARDAEAGRRKLIEVQINGAENDEAARKAARSVASSLLVKTAVYGQDPNWGRIMMALGKSAIKIQEDKIQIFINGIQIVEAGRSISFNIQSVVQSLAESTVELRVELNIGTGFGKAWGGELTEEYIVFNSAYTT